MGANLSRMIQILFALEMYNAIILSIFLITLRQECYKRAMVQPMMIQSTALISCEKVMEISMLKENIILTNMNLPALSRANLAERSNVQSCIGSAAHLWGPLIICHVEEKTTSRLGCIVS